MSIVLFLLGGGFLALTWICIVGAMWERAALENSGEDDSIRCRAEESLTTVIEPAVDQAEFDRWVRFGLVTHQAALMWVPSTVHAAFAEPGFVRPNTPLITPNELAALHAIPLPRVDYDDGADVIEIQSFGGETFTRRIEPPKPPPPVERPRPFREWISDLHQQGAALADWSVHPQCLCAECRVARELALDACVDR